MTKQLFCSGILTVFALVFLAMASVGNIFAMDSPAAPFNKLPLLFEENQGQADPATKFVSRHAGELLLFQDHEVLLLLSQSNPVKTSNVQISGNEKPAIIETDLVRMKLIGSNPQASIQAIDQQAARINYLIGNDPSRWHRNVTTFGRIKYQSIYPGTDLVFYGSGGRLEFDFVQLPDANAKNIKIQFEGSKKLVVAPAGDLQIHTSHGILTFHRPRIYQEIENKKAEVSGNFVLLSPDTAGFDVGEHDPQSPLVIDPILNYSTYLGGSTYDAARGVAVDSSGFAYLTGNTSSTNFPMTNQIGTARVFVSKIDPSGSALVYSTLIGGNGTGDSGLGIVVDASGNAYVTGQTFSTNFPTTAATAFQPNCATNCSTAADAFFFELDATGGNLLYSTYLGGSNSISNGFEAGEGVALGGAGTVYVTGFTTATDFPTKNAFQTDQGGEDAFVTRFDPSASGNASVMFSTYLGGSGSDDGLGIAAAQNNMGFDRIYVTGEAGSNDFPMMNAIDPTFGGGDAFVSKFSEVGNLLFSTYLGCPTQLDFGWAIDADGNGNAYVTGLGCSGFPTTANAYQNCGTADAFATKMDTVTPALVYSTCFGGSSFEQGRGIGRFQNIMWIAGATGSSDMPVSANAFDPSCGSDGACNASEDGFVAKFDVNQSGATSLVYASYVGGSGDEDLFGGGNTAAVDNKERIYLVGGTNSPDFPAVNPFQTAQGDYDGFLAIFGCLYCDYFNNGVLASDWDYQKGTWAESGGALTATLDTKKAIAIASTAFAGCNLCNIETAMSSAGGAGNKLSLYGWYVDKGNNVEVLMKQDKGKWILRQHVGGSTAGKSKVTATINAGTFYKVNVLFDGTTFSLLVDDLLLTTLTATGSPAGTVGFVAKKTTGTFNRIVADQ